MDEELIPFQTVLDTLADINQEIPDRILVEFSDIPDQSLASLLEAWPRIEPSRKLTLLERLNALADVDTLVSFDDLGRALLTDTDSRVRVGAMHLLAECNDYRLIPVYINILTKDFSLANHLMEIHGLIQFAVIFQLVEMLKP